MDTWNTMADPHYTGSGNTPDFKPKIIKSLN